MMLLDSDDVDARPRCAETSAPVVSPIRFPKNFHLIQSPPHPHRECNQGDEEDNDDDDDNNLHAPYLFFSSSKPKNPETYLWCEGLVAFCADC